MKPKPYRVLRFVQFVYSIIGWIGIVASFFVFGVAFLIALGSNSSGGILLAVLAAIPIGLSTFVGAILALAIASIIDMLFEIQKRVFALPTELTIIPMEPRPELAPAQPAPTAQVVPSSASLSTN